MVKMRSNKNPSSGKTFPEFPWRTTFFSFENAVEIRDIIKPAMVSHFRDRMGGFDQDAARMAQPDFREAVDKSISCPLPEEPAERNIGHICQSGNLR